MRLTKHAHSCVEIADGDDRVLIDPGVFTPNAAELIDAAATILITHEHPDHVHAEAVRAALEERPGLRVIGPEAVVGPWRPDFHAQVHAVAEGDIFTAGALEVRVFGRDHAVIHRDLPTFANVGYLVGGRVYHPGDSYAPPPTDVEVLLVPVSGPWTKVADAVELVRAVAPARLLQIHEAMLSEIGLRSVGRFLSPEGLIDVALEQLDAGETVEL
ncbi:MBL fold metallo-hydrolase [Demequina sp.]|uniref:MBL fold metallo-hydrolase n=1 Tax=Demequina sp. TaxID=2050685 RepID=UPI0025F2AF72|nr:MBL fold metallo-hydrolase [Demequina sp.]